MDQIVDKFREIPTTCISDAMKGLNNLHPSIKPIEGHYKLAGRAFTVKTPVGDNLAVLKAIREANPGDIIVVDAKGDEYRAIAGDFFIEMAKTLGIGGLVADGAIRDLMGIKDLNFPVFAKGTTVAASAKDGGGEINVPISCGGVSVEPGDIIVGDVDGVIVIPHAREQEILKDSLDKLKQDHIREDMISGNVEKTVKFLDELLAKK